MTLGTGGLDETQTVIVSSMPAETNAVLTAVEDTIGHTLGVQVKGVRPAAAGCFAHRTNLTLADFVGPATSANQAAPTAPTLTTSGVADTPQLTHAPTTYYGAYVIRNGMGMTMTSAIGSYALSASTSVRLTIPAAWGSTPSDTDLTYEIFFGTSATAPLHVGTWTGAQLAAGAGAGTGCFITAVETPLTNGTGRAAWGVDIAVVGTGLGLTSAPFPQSAANITALSQASIAAITPVSTSGYNNADVFVDAIPTGYAVGAATPSLTLIPAYLNDKEGSPFYHVGAPIYVNLLGGTGQNFRQVYNLTTNGASVMILVASIANCTVNRIDITPTSVV